MSRSSRRGGERPHVHVADRYNVSKELLDETSIHSVMRAVEGVNAEISSIAGALRLKSNTIKKLEQQHQHNHDRLAISLMDTWLRGDYIKDKPREPYSLHEEQYQHPSWWNLVWAVNYSNPAHAANIAKNYKDFEKHEDTTEYDQVSSEPYSENDAGKIVPMLEDVHYKWYEMGVALKIPTSKLNEMVGTKNTGTCFRMMIEYWLKHIQARDGREPCLRLLLIAVAASYGGENPALAQDLKQAGNIKSDDASAPEPMNKRAKYEDDPPSSPGSTEDDENHRPTVPGSIKEDGLGKKVSDEVKRRFLPYPINKRQHHGLALVIVNKKFKRHPNYDTEEPLNERKCAELDLQRLTEVLEKFEFRVRVEEDKTAEEMESLFNEVRVQDDPAKTVQDGDDSFVCCISSHGGWDPTLNTDVVFGSTGVVIQEGRYKVPKGALDVKKHAYESFSPSKTGCPILEGKPKLFLVQACRGSVHGIVDYDDTSKGTVEVKPRHLPRETDFLFAYATAPGKTSYRYVDTSGHGAATHEASTGRPFGSFFISYLCDNLKSYAEKLPLAPIIDLVSQDLAAGEKNEFMIETKTGDGTKRIAPSRQSPHIMSSLRGPVFFSNKARQRYKRTLLSGLT